MKNSSRRTVSAIALVAPAVAREGITKQIANQIIGLHLNGVKVSLILLAKSDLNILKEYGVNVEQLAVLELNQPDAYLSLNVLKRSASLIRPILRFLKACKVEVVIAHAPYAHFIMRLAKLGSFFTNSGFKLIQYYHGLQYSEYPVNNWKRRSINSMNKWLAKRCDDVHVSVSEIVKGEIENNLVKHSNHTVIPNCLTVHDSWNDKTEEVWQQLQPLLHQVAGKYIILLPNRIDQNKGQLFFLGVLDVFLQSGIASAADIAVFIVGDGPQKKTAEQVVQARNLESVVMFAGALPHAVVQKFMMQAQLVVIPSFKEGFSFVALEALSVGCLTLSSDAGGLKEIIQDGKNGFIFKAGDMDDCLNKLTMLYSNRNSTLLDREAVKNDVKKRFSFDKHMQKLLQTIETT